MIDFINSWSNNINVFYLEMLYDDCVWKRIFFPDAVLYIVIRRCRWEEEGKKRTEAEDDIITGGRRTTTTHHHIQQTTLLLYLFDHLYYNNHSHLTCYDIVNTFLRIQEIIKIKHAISNFRKVHRQIEKNRTKLETCVKE